MDFPFVRTKAQRIAAAKTPKVAKPSLADENAVLRAKLAAMQVERDFWSEQARQIQNHLQTVMRGQGSILEQLARAAPCEAQVHEAIAMMGEQLRAPLTTVEATMALAAASREGSIGKYTAVNQHQKGGLVNERA